MQRCEECKASFACEFLYQVAVWFYFGGVVMLTIVYADGIYWLEELYEVTSVLMEQVLDTNVVIPYLEGRVCQMRPAKTP